MVVQSNHNMKMIITIACCLFSLTGLNAQEIAVKNLKDKYSMKEKISFTISNTSDSCLEYTVCLEMMDNDGWREVSYDVFNYTPDRSARLFSILTGDSLKHTFLPSRLLGNHAKGKQFRLKFPAGYCNRNNWDHIIYSSPFRLTN